jgi:glyoxylase I family protein
MLSEPPFALERIDHVLLLVQGMNRAIAFYEGVLGCRVESRLPQYGMAELAAGASHIDLVDTAASQGSWALPAVEGGRNVDHVCLVLGAHDEPALRRHLAAHHIEIVEERSEEDARGSRLSLYVRDPSGNTIELMGPTRL